MNKPELVTDPEKKSSLFAAQPIFDKNLQRIAVELLYRSDSGVNALEIGEELATTELIYNLCSGISNQITHYQVPAFINVSADFLMSGSFLPLEPEKVVIELVERIEPTAQLISCVGELKRRGFSFALDDFEFDASWDPLLALADYVKVDILTCSLEKLDAQLARLKRFNVILLAERVETQEQFNYCQEKGFSLFQGYFLARPEIVRGKKVSASALKLAQLTEVLFVDEPDINKLSTLLADEPSLVLGMLRIANSPLYRKTRDVSSVKELVMRLGLDLTRKWVLMFAVLNQAKPIAANLVLTRAYFMQNLAQLWQVPEQTQSQFFLTGLLSGVDILYEVAPADFIADLNIAAEIKSALCEGQSRAARAIECAKSIERAYSLKTDERNIPQQLFELYNTAQYFVQEKFSQFNAAPS